MKYDYKKQEKTLYGAKTTPCVLEIPAQNFITLTGIGNPNEEIFSHKVSALFSLAYALKMAYKKSQLLQKDKNTGENIDDYAVYPLEGIWGKKQAAGHEQAKLDKDELHYKIMICQPHFIGREHIESTKESRIKKKKLDYLTDIDFETMQEGKCVQMLHKGAFDDEPKTFAIMDSYCLAHHLTRIDTIHTEIYLSNPHRTAPCNFKTILRYRVR